MAPASHSRDIIGPFGRTLSDVALLDSIVVGGPIAKAISLGGVRLGVPRSTGWTDLDSQIKTVADAALVTLQKAGAELIEVDMSEIIALDQQHGFPIALFETLLDVPTYLIAGDTGVTYDELIEKIVSPQVKSVITQAPHIPLEVYRAALAGRAKMLSLYAMLWEKHKIAALVFPTTVLPARPIGQEDTVELNGKQVPTFPTFIRNTGPASAVGLPGLSIPIGMTKSGLPVGLEFDGPAWQDHALLSLGLSAERLSLPLPPPPLPSHNKPVKSER
jgi:mandelamide amidase